MVEKVGLSKRELDRIQARSDLRAKAQGFAQPKKVVGGIRSSDEAAGDSRNAAVQLDGVFAAFLHFERDIDGIGLGIALDIGGFLSLQRFKVTQLIQAQDAQLPQPVIENLAFVDQQLATDHLIARRSVTGKIDAPNEKLMA